MKNKAPYFFLVLAAILAAVGIVLWIYKPKSSVTEDPRKDPESQSDPKNNKPPVIDGIDKPLPKQTPEEILANLDVGLATVNPSDLLDQISQALNKGDIAEVSKLIGKDAMDPETFKILTI